MPIESSMQLPYSH